MQTFLMILAITFAIIPTIYAIGRLIGKRNPYLDWVAYGHAYIGMFVLGLFIFPISYIKRKKLRKKGSGFLWWFLNDDEGNELSNDYGDAGWRADNNIKLEGRSKFALFLISYRWAALRNPHYNFKLHVLVPIEGREEEISLKHNSPIQHSLLDFRDKWTLGKQHITYDVELIRYFRYSFARPIKWFGKQKIFNVQFGARNNDDREPKGTKPRFLYKVRITAPAQ